mgnify:CR=1 FL=1
MRRTWRWFGPQDRVTVDDMLQASVEGVVSALHHVPTGVVWSATEIAQRQAEIARMKDGKPSGLAWEVVESLPVSEDIKKQSGAWRDHVALLECIRGHDAESAASVIRRHVDSVFETGDVNGERHR